MRKLLFIYFFGSHASDKLTRSQVLFSLDPAVQVCRLNNSQRQGKSTRLRLQDGCPKQPVFPPYRCRILSLPLKCSFPANKNGLLIFPALLPLLAYTTSRKSNFQTTSDRMECQAGGGARASAG